MKNQIYAAQADGGGKWAAFMYRYHTKPSGSIIPLLIVSSQFAFNSAQEAAEHLWVRLKPETRANTEICIGEEKPD